MNHKSPERAKLDEEIIPYLQAIPANLLPQKQVNQKLITRKTAVKKNYVFHLFYVFYLFYVVKKKKPCGLCCLCCLCGKKEKISLRPLRILCAHCGKKK
jgi:hypothetical protein